MLPIEFLNQVLGTNCTEFPLEAVTVFSLSLFLGSVVHFQPTSLLCKRLFQKHQSHNAFE